MAGLISNLRHSLGQGADSWGRDDLPYPAIFTRGVEEKRPVCLPGCSHKELLQDFEEAGGCSFGGDGGDGEWGIG